MANKRIQVRDLEAPERIQPAPVQSSTFAEAAKPPIDHSLDALAKGLGVFASGVNHLAAKQKAEDEKRLKVEQLGAYEAWKASKSSDEQLDAIRSGQLPITVDRILDTVVKKDGAALEARKIAEEVDAKLPAAGLGSEKFDADAFVRGVAAPYVSRIARDPYTMGYLGDHLDRIRGGVQKRHEDVRGQLQTQFLMDRGREEIARGIQYGVENGWNGQRIMDALRNPDPSKGIYAAVGPRKSGGALDLAYGELDKITLDLADEMAGKPETVRTAIELISAQRKSVDGGVDIGTLRASNKHNPKVDAILKKAQKTIGDATEAGVKAEIDAGNLALLENGGAGFSTVSDFKRQNPGDGSREITYSRDDQRKRAVQAWLDKTRAANGGQIDLAAEVNFLMDRGIKHPNFEKSLNEAYVGFLNSTVAGQPALDRIPEIVKLGDEYIRITERNPAFAETLVSKDAREFYDTYRVLRRYMGMDPDAAAQATAAGFSNPDLAKDPQILAGRRREVEDQISRMDLSPWWPGGEVNNSFAARQMLVPLAGAIARTSGQDIKTALEQAAEHLSKSSAYVNGRLINSPGITKDDKPHVERFLEVLYDQHKEALAAQGITSASQMSLLSRGPTSFMVVRADTAQLLRIPKYDPMPSDATDVPADAKKPTAPAGLPLAVRLGLSAITGRSLEPPKTPRPIESLDFFQVQAGDILKLREAASADARKKGMEKLQRAEAARKATKTTPDTTPWDTFHRAIERGETPRFME